jgi:hypothetical protein
MEKDRLEDLGVDGISFRILSQEYFLITCTVMYSAQGVPRRRGSYWLRSGRQEGS